MTRTDTPRGHTALLRAARDEFAERGYAGASIRHLAERADMSLSALYHYYPGKQQLLEAIVAELVGDYFRACEAELAAVGDGPVERLGAMVTATIRERVAGPTRRSLIQSERRNFSSDFLASYDKRMTEADQLFREPIDAGVAAGLFRTPHPGDARRAIMAMCNAVGDWYNPDGPLTLDEVIARQIELALVIVQYRAKPGRSRRPPVTPSRGR
jgi:AcrR family transcriptional regulator